MLQEQIKKTNKRLFIEWMSVWIIGAIIIGLFECNIIEPGATVGNDVATYYINLIGILLLVVTIPTALKWMSLRIVKTRISHTEENKVLSLYVHYCRIRTSLLALCGCSNIVCYYVTLEQSGAFCGIITAIAMLFCIPSENRIVIETCRNKL